MKNKLRKIITNQRTYLYSVTDQFHAETETNTLTVKIFLNGEKQTPLIIDFLTFDDYIMGQPLKSGISLMNIKTNSMEVININEPKYIHQFILQGIEKGWSGKNKIKKQNGLNYLAELGYKVEPLRPN